ncbi:mannonate dehydratase [Siphonobacter sp. BAB-5405]|uniref:mannonate dehydratase n=1 Tax=Siphonobacter sp. BAB-5405 TaxID=1864825 RepID=UPI000C809FDC|nr:mannonate dehydratase [Siphonobacter sp. BAB-5405]PMD98427.1 mannonate dehydratase [Siphonobacter sp. BAB-5405]
MPLLQSFRWFGPKDPVRLSDIRQAGATGIVSALHEVPNGKIWTPEAIESRKTLIEAAGLEWAVVESVPVHEHIKRAMPDRDQLIANYQQTLRNLAQQGITTVCYNFMPVLDWTRTDLAYVVPDGSEALRFDAVAFAAFELFILKRSAAEAEYSESFRQRAEVYFKTLNESQKALLIRNIIAGLPGSEESFTVEQFQKVLDYYAEIGDFELRQNLYYFLRAVVPVAEEVGVKLCIHPDDPPRPILGLPRVVSTAADIREMFSVADSPANGLTFCTGSFGVRADNDLPAMLQEFGPRTYFLHLRSVHREIDEVPETFHEANHLEGHAGMYEVMKAAVGEMKRREKEGRTDVNIPMRPDHGHRMLDDLNPEKRTNPGYTAIGRLRGLAELRGLELGITQSL